MYNCNDSVEIKYPVKEIEREILQIQAALSGGDSSPRAIYLRAKLDGLESARYSILKYACKDPSINPLLSGGAK